MTDVMLKLETPTVHRMGKIGVSRQQLLSAVFILLLVAYVGQGFIPHRGLSCKYPRSSSLKVHADSVFAVMLHKNALAHFEDAPFSFALLTSLTDDPFEHDVFDEMSSPVDSAFYGNPTDDDSQFDWTEWPQEPYEHIDGDEVIEELHAAPYKARSNTEISSSPTRYVDMQLGAVDNDVSSGSMNLSVHEGVPFVAKIVDHGVHDNPLEESISSPAIPSGSWEGREADETETLSTDSGDFDTDTNVARSVRIVDDRTSGRKSSAPRTTVDDTSKKIAELLQAAVKATEAAVKATNGNSYKKVEKSGKHRLQQMLGREVTDAGNATETTESQIQSEEMKKPKLKPLNLDFTTSHKQMISFNDTKAAAAYLSLPASEYSVLDKSIISRCDVSPNDTFVLNLPIGDLLFAARTFRSPGIAQSIGGGTSTVLRTSVTVEPDAAEGVVHMRSGPLLLETTINSFTDLDAVVGNGTDPIGSADIAFEVLAQALPEWLVWAGDRSKMDAQFVSNSDNTTSVKSSIQAGFELKLQWKKKEPVEFWKGSYFDFSKVFNFNSKSVKSTPSYTSSDTASVPLRDEKAFSDSDKVMEEMKEEAHLWVTDSHKSGISVVEDPVDTAAAIEAAVSATSEAFATAGTAVSKAVNATMEVYTTMGVPSIAAKATSATKKRLHLLAMLLRRQMPVIAAAVARERNRLHHVFTSMLLQASSKFPALKSFYDSAEFQKFLAIIALCMGSIVRTSRHLAGRLLDSTRLAWKRLMSYLMLWYMRQKAAEEVQVSGAYAKVQQHRTLKSFQPLHSLGIPQYGSRTELPNAAVLSSSIKSPKQTKDLNKIKPLDQKHVGKEGPVKTETLPMNRFDIKKEVQKTPTKTNAHSVSKLAVSADIKVWVDLSLPIQEEVANVLNVLPVKALLSQAGSLITNTVLKSASPKLSKLLVEDYEKWKVAKYQKNFK